MSKLMQDKVGIVTAGGFGIGRASALKFASEGAKVVVSDFDDEKGNETVQLIKEAGGEAIYIHCDVSFEDQVINLIEKTIEHYGRLDWAHNNAGVGAVSKPISETETADWNRVQGVTTTGMYFCLKHETKAMLETGGGAIVNTSSTSGLVGAPNLAMMSASKWAINGLTKAVALEYGKKGIRVNSICPGMTITAAVEHWMKDAPEQAAAFEDKIPMGRMGRPEEQANAAVWLCSDQASYITGVNLAIDGGVTAE